MRPGQFPRDRSAVSVTQQHSCWEEASPTLETWCQAWEGQSCGSELPFSCREQGGKNLLALEMQSKTENTGVQAEGAKASFIWATISFLVANPLQTHPADLQPSSREWKTRSIKLKSYLKSMKESCQTQLKGNTAVGLRCTSLWNTEFFISMNIAVCALCLADLWLSYLQLIPWKLGCVLLFIPLWSVFITYSCRAFRSWDVSL